jgi:hypothetical protein
MGLRNAGSDETKTFNVVNVKWQQQNIAVVMREVALV